MASTRRKERATCDECGSTRFHRQDDGYLYCQRNHRQTELGTQIENETEELLAIGTRQRKKDDQVSISQSVRILSSKEATQRYLQCLQLVFRKQLRWLIDEQKLSPELEHVARDLWALRIQKIRTAKTDMEEEDDQQVFSSQTAGTDSQGNDDDRAPRNFVVVIDTVSLLYLGVLLLRIPVCIGDLIIWINNGHLPYYQASKVVPADIRAPLPGRLQRLLEPETLLSGQDLHSSVLGTMRLLDKEYGMRFPAINHTLLIAGWIRKLSLPIEVYPATSRLCEMLGSKFEFSVSNDAGPQLIQKFSDMPEIHLMANLVVAVKMLFPIDEVIHHSATSSDLSALSIDWQQYLHMTEQTRAFEDAFAANEEDCLAMTAEQLDQYLHWYERIVASEEISERGRAGRDADFRRAMAAMFPAPSTMSTSDVEVRMEASFSTKIQDERLADVQSKLRPKPIVHETAQRGDQVGAFHRRYRTFEELARGEKAMQRLYELAARHSGVSVELMVGTVYSVERKLEQLETKHSE